MNELVLAHLFDVALVKVLGNSDEVKPGRVSYRVINSSATILGTYSTISAASEAMERFADITASETWNCRLGKP